MRDHLQWVAQAKIEKFDADDIKAYARRGKFATVVSDDNGFYVPRDEIVAAGIKPYEVVENVGNLLCTAGVTRIWNLFTNQGATQAFDATHTRVGTGNTANAAGSEAAGDTDLAGASKYFQLVGGAGTVTTNSLAYTATFPTGQGNYAWNEWGIDNGTASSATVTAPLLNHKIVSGGLGTKTSSASWAFTVTLSLT
jgi:hypothetical protein